MEFHGLNLPTIASFALLSMLLTWLISSFLDAREEKKRELESRKALDRLESPYANSPTDESD